MTSRQDKRIKIEATQSFDESLKTEDICKAVLSTKIIEKDGGR
jgi:hypothetical protein